MIILNLRIEKIIRKFLFEKIYRTQTEINEN